jgi:hypothetical protein
MSQRLAALEEASSCGARGGGPKLSSVETSEGLDVPFLRVRLSFLLIEYQVTACHHLLY